MKKIKTKCYSCFNIAMLLTIVGGATYPIFTLAEAGAKSMFADEGASVMMGDDNVTKPTAVKTTKSSSYTPSSADYTAVDKSESNALPDSYAGVQYWVDLQEPNGTTRRVTTSHVFHSGDGIKLQIKSKTAGYLYVFNQDASGTTTPLYPIKGQPSDLIQPNVIRTIPSRGAIRFDNVPGTEKVTIALSKYPVNQLVPDSSPKGVTASYNNEPYNDCASSGAGSKGMFADESSTSAVDCIRSNHSAGSKGMFAEEDTYSAQPASYSVIPASSLEDGQVMFVDFYLTHR